MSEDVVEEKHHEEDTEVEDEGRVRMARQVVHPHRP